jgi:hypothetical protein
MKANDPKASALYPDGIETLARLKELYLPSTKDFVFIDVPEMQFVMIDGKGSPDGEQYSHAMRWLFSAIYPIKRIAKERLGRDFVEPPLEALWWADDMNDLIAGHKGKLQWRLMIVTADWVSNEMFDHAVGATAERLGEAPTSLRLERFGEGRCVQILHVGDYSSEAAVVAQRLHNEFLPQHDLLPNGHHHEIYLSDPNRVAPERMRTVLRQPVR